jgi:hypothetical protein
MITNHLTSLSHLLARYQYQFRDELELQDAIAQIMQDDVRWRVEREVPLSPKDRIDFIVERMMEGKGDGVEVGVEVKVKAPLAYVERQLKRYAEHSRLAGMLVVSSSVQLARLPKEICGKPIRVCLVGTTLL